MCLHVPTKHARRIAARHDARRVAAEHNARRIAAENDARRIAAEHDNDATVSDAHILAQRAATLAYLEGRLTDAELHKMTGHVEKTNDRDYEVEERYVHGDEVDWPRS